jgi:dTDP-4-amino-4,6-dideoxygalactose transaminase
MKRIYLSPPHMSGKEQGFVSETFQSNWIAPLGPNVDALEQDLSNYTGVDHSVVLSSGTSAIHLALILLGVKSGDYVIVQSFTFSATINPVLYLGAIPIMIDSESETWNMCPDMLEDVINRLIKEGERDKIKAIIGVNLYGMPANWDEILKTAKKYGISTIEDAAESLGSRYDNKMCGSLGNLGIISFNGNKIITTSGGGALLSEDKSKIEKARYLATQARDPAPHYQHSEIGYNYRMSNILAGIGRGQLEVIEDRVASRRFNNEYYRKAFAEIPGFSFQTEPSDKYYSNYWLTAIVINPQMTEGITREDIRLALEKENIESRPLWKPMHLQPVLSNYPSFTNGISEELFNNGLCLPSGSSMSLEDLERVVYTVNALLR